MKKIIALLLITTTLLLTGCNRQIIDVTYTFNYAYIELQNGECVEGEIKNWRDYENSDQIQITMKNGNVYLVHSVNCTLIKK